MWFATFSGFPRRCFMLMLVTLFTCVTTATNAANNDDKQSRNNKPLTLGFFPIISTVALYKRFAPLRDYLSEELGRPVILKTAKDFSTFVRRTDERRYDIVVTAPHFAVRATDSGKYRIRASLLTNVQQLIVVRSDSAITDIRQLAGRRIATPPKGALMTMMGQHLLESAGLVKEKAPGYIAFTSHNAANEAVIAGEVDAAIASSNIIKKAIMRGDALKTLVAGEKLPNMATLVASDLDPVIGDRIVRILVDMKKSDKGRYILKKIAFPGYRPVTARDYEPARPYMDKVRARYDQAQP